MLAASCRKPSALLPNRFKTFLGKDAKFFSMVITSKPQVANGQWLILIFKKLRQDLILKLLQAKLFSNNYNFVWGFFQFPKTYNRNN